MKRYSIKIEYQFCGVSQETELIKYADSPDEAKLLAENDVTQTYAPGSVITKSEVSPSSEPAEVSDYERRD
jgi:hypothetical protein